MSGLIDRDKRSHKNETISKLKVVTTARRGSMAIIEDAPYAANGTALKL